MRLILIYCFFIAGLLYSQDPHQYFPHQKGNIWQYKDGFSGDSYSNNFLRDSVDNEGNIFINTVPSPMSSLYWTYKVNKSGDSVYYIPNGRNMMIYKFPLQVGNSWKADDLLAVVEDEHPIYFNNKLTSYFVIAYWPDSTKFHWRWWEKYIEGIGTIQYNDEVNSFNLTGCVIAGDTVFGQITEIINDKTPIAKDYKLYQNYPNPFNPTTTIQYEIPSMSPVKIKVYDILGKEIETLVNEVKPQGKYSVSFNASHLVSGVYFCQINAGRYTAIKKMILLK